MECRAIPFQKAVLTPYKVLNPPLATTGDRGLGEVVSRMVDWPRELCLAQRAMVDTGSCGWPRELWLTQRAVLGQESCGWPRELHVIIHPCVNIISNLQSRC